MKKLIFHWIYPLNVICLPLSFLLAGEAGSSPTSLVESIGRVGYEPAFP